MWNVVIEVKFLGDDGRVRFSKEYETPDPEDALETAMKDMFKRFGSACLSIESVHIFARR